MTVNDDLRAVVLLACLTESRTDAEQRALLRTARRIDAECNANVTGNHAMWGVQAGSTHAELVGTPSTLEGTVHNTRLVDEDARDHDVRLPVPKRWAGGINPFAYSSVAPPVVRAVPDTLPLQLGLEVVS